MNEELAEMARQQEDVSNQTDGSSERLIQKDISPDSKPQEDSSQPADDAQASPTLQTKPSSTDEPMETSIPSTEKSNTESNPDPKPGEEEVTDPKKQPRLWKDAAGKFSTEATFNGIVGKTEIFLKKADGKVVKVAIEKLSDDDKAWLQENTSWKPEQE